LAFGSIGHYELCASRLALGLSPTVSWLDSFIFAAGLAAINTNSDGSLVLPGGCLPEALQAARVCGLLLPPYAFFVLVGSLFSGGSFRRMRIALWRCWPCRRHIVVCGAGWKGREIACSLRRAGHSRIVVVEREPDHPHRAVLEQEGVVFLVGDARSPSMLRTAGVQRAAKIYAVCADDATNGRIVQLLRDMEGGRRKPTGDPVEVRRGKGNGQRQPAWRVRVSRTPTKRMVRVLIRLRRGPMKSARWERPLRVLTRYSVWLHGAVGGRVRGTVCYAHILGARMRQLLPDEWPPRDADRADSNQWGTREYRALGGAEPPQANRPLRARRLSVVTFSMYESTARLLFEKRQVFRVPATARRPPAACLVVVIGSSPMADAVLLQALRTGVLARRVKADPVAPASAPAPSNASDATITEARLQVMVIDRDIAARRRKLYAEFPCLDPEAFAGEPWRSRLEECFPPIEFVELPQAESRLLADDFALYARIRESDKAVLLYCIDDGFESTALCTLMQPQLRDAAGTCQLHVFPYCSLPDEQSTTAQADCPEAAAGAGLPTWWYEPFDDLLGDCSHATVEGEPVDRLAREISALYSFLYSSIGDDQRECPDAWCRKRQRSRRRGLCASGGVTHQGAAPVAPALPADAGVDPRVLAEIARVTAQVASWGRCHHGKHGARHEECRFYRLWSTQSEDDRDSNRQAADHVPVKLWALGLSRQRVCEPDFRFTSAQVQTLADMEHRRWCAEKYLKGFVPYGGESPEWRTKKALLKARRRHYCLRRFGELDAGEQVKDYGQILGIPGCLRRVGGAVGTGAASPATGPVVQAPGPGAAAGGAA